MHIKLKVHFGKGMRKNRILYILENRADICLFIWIQLIPCYKKLSHLFAIKKSSHKQQ